VTILRKLQSVLLVLAAAVVLAVPATATVSHQAAHLGAPVADGQHHHHDGDGVAEAQGNADPDQQDNQTDTKGVGHSHAPVELADPARLAGADIALKRVVRDLPQEWVARELGNLSWSPQRRPPRTA